MKTTSLKPSMFFIKICFVVFCLGGSLQVARADTLMATIGNGGTLSTLVVVDRLTGELRTVGPVGYAVNGMEWYNGKLYGTTSFNDPSFLGLIEIDPSTGAGTPIGTGWGGVPSGAIVELAIDSGGRAFGWGESGDDLHEIDLTAGTAALVGESGISTATNGIAFDLADNLYLINYNGAGTHDINPDTGLATNLGDVGVYAHHGDVAFDNGHYYGLDYPFSGTNELYEIDLDTLTVQSTVVTDETVHTLAFIPTPYTLLGTMGNGDDLSLASILVTVDTNTGTVTPIGPVGYLVNGMDWYNGKLYGTTSDNDPSFQGLIEIDPLTGAGSPIGTGWGGSITADIIAEMAIDSAGNAYGWGERNEDDLYAIDLANGTATRVGESGLNTQAFGIAFDLVDNLYLINRYGDVHEVDPTTGSGSASLGNIGVEAAHHGDTAPDSGAYYGLSVPWDPTVLRKINLHTLTVVSNVPLDQQVHTLAFVPTSVLWSATDNFGYLATNTDPFMRDISTTGTELVLGDDQVSEGICIPFDFDFYGEEVSEVFVSSNGFIKFRPNLSTDGCCSGHPIPNPAFPNTLIAGFWDDLDPPLGGTIRYEVLGTRPNRELVVGFYDIHNHPDNTTPTATFEMILHESTLDIELQYDSAVGDGDSFTSIGIENQDGTDGIQILRQENLEVYDHGYLITHPCPYRLAGDENSDCVVDLTDVAISSQNWLVDCVITPGDPACEAY